MGVSREAAWQKLNQMIDNANLIKHCLAVESVMAVYADFYNISENKTEKWKVAGLIHDADWEKFPNDHPNIIVEWLKQNDAGSDLINAVEAHGWEFGVEAKFLMAKVLRAVDELTGLIVAVALVKGKKLTNVSVESVLKKWKKKDFAKGVKREDIEKGAEDLELDLEKHIAIVLRAMQNNSNELGL